MIKVLFVDDEVMAMEYLQNMISWEDEGFYVVGHARSGKKALEIYEKEKEIITDCHGLTYGYVDQRRST